MVSRPIAPFSFSSFSDFVSCPRKFFETRILKRWQEDQNTDHLVWGREVHKAFEDRQRDGIGADGKPVSPLPDNLASHEPFMKRLEAIPGKLFVEQRIALNTKLEPCEFFAEDCFYRGVIDWIKVDLNATPEYGRATIVDYKGLPLDTLISTPTGFTTMADVQVGDMVHGSDGMAYPVLIKSQVHTRPCFTVKFDDKTSVVCDNVHLWSLVDGSVVPVTELVPGKSCIPVAAPVAMSEKMLPIDPYVLGLWLADGKHTSGEICKPHEFVWNEIKRRGYNVGPDIGSKDRCCTRTVYGIRGYLTSLGLMRNKHIPEIYLCGSVQQRIDLLRGLMDGDGSVNPARKQVVYQSVNKRLSDDVKVLVESLGQRCSQGRTRYSGFGVTGIAYPISWRPQGFNPFLLPHKAAKVQRDWGRGQSWFRRVVAVEPTAPRETQCIGVGSPDNTYLCTSSRIVTHNTGKVNEKWRQLILNALWVFQRFGETKNVRIADCRFYWTKDPEHRSQKVYGYGERDLLWKGIIPDLKQYKEAFKLDSWQPRKSGLCRAHCPVLDCENNGKTNGSYRGR